MNAMLLPITTCTISGLQALSPDARCKTFDASADGYGRGEGFAGPCHLMFFSSPVREELPLLIGDFTLHF